MTKQCRPSGSVSRTDERTLVIAKSAALSGSRTPQIYDGPLWRQTQVSRELTERRRRGIRTGYKGKNVSADGFVDVGSEDAQVNDGTLEKRLLVALALGCQCKPLQGASLGEKDVREMYTLTSRQK